MLSAVVVSTAMSKLLVVLLVVLVQIQPLTGLLLCEQHQMGGPAAPIVMPMSDREHSHPALPRQHVPLPSDCPFMSSCTVPAPAPVPETVRILELLPVAPQRFARPGEHPTAVFSAPPFHPPSA